MNLLHFIFISLILPQNEGDFNADDGDKISAIKFLSITYSLHYEKFNDGSVKCIEDEIPFELPDGWEWTRLQSICSLLTDGTHKTPTYSDDGYIFLSSKNVTSGVIDWDNIMHIPESLHQELYKRLAPQRNDILLAKNGTTGITALVDRDIIFDIYVSLALIRITDNIIKPSYILNIIGSSYVQNYFAGSLKGIGVPNLHLEQIRNTLLPIPPYSEQNRICSQLEELLPLAERIYSEKIDLKNLVDSAKAKILDLAIRGKLVPQDPNDEPASVLLERIHAEKEELIKQGKIKHDKKESVIFKGDDNSYYETIDGKTVCIDEQLPYEVPYNWSWCRLKNIASPEENSFVDGPFGSNLKTDHYTTNREVRIIQLNNIGELEWKNSGVRYTTFQHAETLSRCKSYPGDIVIAKMMPAGRAIIIPPVEQVFIISSDCVRLRPSKIENTEYLMFMINSPIINKCVLDNVQGIGRTRTSLTKLKELLVPIPPLAEQASIVEQIHIAYKQLDFISKALA